MRRSLSSSPSNSPRTGGSEAYYLRRVQGEPQRGGQRKTGQWGHVVRGSHTPTPVLVLQVKEAELVGIVVTNLSIRSYAELVSRLQHLLHVMGRKSCVLMVGKLNVPKLANFDQVDLFTVVACPACTLVDDKEYPKPIVTPQEVCRSVCNSWDFVRFFLI